MRHHDHVSERFRRWWYHPRSQRARFAAFVILLAIGVILGYFALVGPMFEGKIK